MSKIRVVEGGRGGGGGGVAGGSLNWCMERKAAALLHLKCINPMSPVFFVALENIETALCFRFLDLNLKCI